jgi:hypothetical protein
MNGTPSATYIVAIPGTDKTQEYSRGNLLAALARGEITRDHWAWSPEANDWVQISTIPALSPQAALTPPPTAGRSFVPAQTAIGPIVNVPEIEPTRVHSPAKAKKKRSFKGAGQFVGYLVQGLCALAYLAIIGVVAANYVLIDQPFDAKIAQSPYVLVTAHAHLGSFIQQNALLIHILPSAEITKDNLGDFLSTLARCTPPSPLDHKPYQVVQLTSSLIGQYDFLGPDWAQLASLNNSNPEAEKDFVIDHLTDTRGNPLVDPEKLSSSQLPSAREQVWQSLLAQFSTK